MSANMMMTAAKMGFVAMGLSLASVAFGVGPAGPEGSATASATPAAASTDKTVAAGREMFNTWGCSACHVLKDADATGHVGPSLDGDANLTQTFLVNRITNGQGAMPAFGGQLSDAEIAQLAAYIAKVSLK
jgi:mono/diheme cytochrome c family protein